MKLVRSSTLYDGIGEKTNYYIGFEDDKITYVEFRETLAKRC